jgi:hypothetical protein
LTACGKPPEPAPAPDPVVADPCLVLPVPADAPDSVVVGLLEGIDPGRVPRPGNYDERFVVRHLYETLVRVDCSGAVRPGLAESWSRSDGGRRWRFKLREDARFWDGEPVFAEDVLASWRMEGSEREIQLAGIDSIRPDDDRGIIVYLDGGADQPPSALADPMFAVARRSANATWPTGTGPYQVAGAGAGTGAGEEPEVGGLEVTLALRPGPGSRRQHITLTSARGFDGRDLLDRGVDVLVTADPVVIEYSGRSGYDRVALPWDRVYVLLPTTRVQALRLGGTVKGLPQEFLDRMAQDAVRGDARGHVLSDESERNRWDRGGSCGDLSDVVEGLPPVPRGAYEGTGQRRIVYEADDPVARDLAERIVALAVGGPRVASEAASLADAVPGLGGRAVNVLAEGLGPVQLKESLRDGNDFAYVLSLPLDPLDTCYELRSLVERVQWLAVEDVDLSTAVLPLVDTRRQVVARSGRVGLSVDFDGTVFVDSRQEPER